MMSISMGDICRVAITEGVSAVTELGRLLRRRRLALGLTQEQLAEMTGLEQHYISQVERGQIARPSRDRLGSFARALELSEEEVLEAAGYIHRVYVEEIRIPLVGRIPADAIRWTAVEEGIEVPSVGVAPEDIQGARSPFALEVTGDCMRAVGIYSGDIVILDRPDGRPPRDGQIVAVRVGEDEYTLKRWCVTADGAVELRDGDGRVVYRLTPNTHVEVLGFYLTFKPRAPR